MDESSHRPDAAEAGDGAARTPRADRIRERRADGPGLLSRLPGIAYQCRDDPDRTLDLVAGACRELTGYGPSVLTGDEGPTPADLLHPDDRERVRETVGTAVEEDRSFELEYRILDREGTERWVWERGHPVRDADGRLLALEGFISDVTTRHVAASRLERSLALFRPVVDQDLFGVYVIQDGRFRFVNDALARIFGYDRAEMVERMGPADLTVEEDRERVADNLRRRESGEVETVQYGFTGLRRGGDRIQVEVHGTRTLLEGEPAICGVLLDVSERRALEEQLRQTQKREALAELTGAVAHDFNNFLTGMIGSVELALDALEPDAEVREYLEQAHGTAERAAGLTRQLLTFSRTDVSLPETFDLNAVVEHMGGLLRQLVGSPINLEVTTSAAPLPVHLDPGHMEQVLMNLVLNARDALPRGGTIAIRTLRAETDEDGGADVVVEVADSGRGIEPETLERIFSPFFTTKEKGTGLGLATVRRIVDDAGGAVDVESAPGEGATFRVRLPAAEEAAAVEVGAPAARRSPRKTAEARSDPTDPARILVVEDDDAVRRMVRAALERHGYRVEAVRTAGEAQERFAGPGPEPDLLLSDVSLPDRSGVELARRFRSRRPGVGVLLTSGYSREEWPDGRPDGPVHDFLKKPFSIDELLTRVRAALGPNEDGSESTGGG